MNMCVRKHPSHVCTYLCSVPSPARACAQVKRLATRQTGSWRVGFRVRGSRLKAQDRANEVETSGADVTNAPAGLCVGLSAAGLWWHVGFGIERVASKRTS
jgi:hypothetical protein